MEDYALLQKTMKILLEKKGIKVTTAKNGKEGLDIYRTTEHFDLILTDLRMSVMNGETMIFKIRHFERLMKMKKTPVLVMTGNLIN